MSKKALVLNGFAGGINKDSDATDLPAEGRGKDQVVSLKNMLADRGGKLRMRRYSSASHTYAGGTTTNGKNDLLIFDDKEYHEQGLYKVGKDVNWSGAISAVKPTALGHTNAQAASIGIGPSFSTKNAEQIFLGAGASQSESTNAIFGGTEQSSSYAINRFIRPICDTDDDGAFADETAITDFETLAGLGFYNTTVINIDLTAHGTYTIVSGSGNVTKESGGLQIAHGVQHDDTSAGGYEYLQIPGKFWQYSAHKIELTVSGMQSGTNVLPLQIDSAADNSGAVIKASFVVPDNGDESETWTGTSADYAANNYLKMEKQLLLTLLARLMSLLLEYVYIVTQIVMIILLVVQIFPS